MSQGRPDFIKTANELTDQESYSYPGDTETFGKTAPLSRKLDLNRIAVNYEVLEPGDRSSWPHAHSNEEELIFIIEGTPEVWVNGEVFALKAGDTVGFKPGIGIAHCLLNNSQSKVVAIVVGERDRKEDKVFYPKHPARNDEMRERGSFWTDHPVLEMGEHDGWTDKKRP